jgi:hypothetical protein
VAEDTTEDLDGEGQSVEGMGNRGSSGPRASVALTPESETLQAIQDLVDNHRNPRIQLEPGVLYEGDTQLYLDSDPDAEQPRVIAIDAWGAGINYTGDEPVAVQLRQGPLVETDDDNNPVNPGDQTFAGHVAINHGTWWGSGRPEEPMPTDKSAVIRCDDTFGFEIRPTGVAGATNGVLALNNEQWCEAVHLGIRTGGGYNGEEAPSKAATYYTIRAAGSGSAYPDQNGGTASFRDADVTIPWAKAANDWAANAHDVTNFDPENPEPAHTAPVTFWQDGTSFHGGKIQVRGFCPAGGSVYRSRSGAYGATVHVESEGGNENAVAVDLRGNHSPPIFVNPRLHVHNWGGTNALYSGAGWPLAITNTGLEKFGGETFLDNDEYISWGKHGQVEHGKLSLYPRDSNGFTWDHRWLDFIDDAGEARFGVGNVGDDFTLQVFNDGQVRTAGSDQSPVPILASAHRSSGAEGTRSHLGTYSRHPESDAGDTWYIDGAAGPAEGFYGQTSDGPVQLG